MKKYIDFNLTSEQMEHANHINWLLSTENIRTGRSYVLATVFIQLSVDNPGVDIRVFDHNVFFYLSDKFMFENIIHIIKTNKSLEEIRDNFTFNKSKRTFKYNL